MRKFHIDQLPCDRIYVLLNEKFHKELFKIIGKRPPFKELSYSTYKKWRYRSKKRKDSLYPRFIPLWFLIRIGKLSHKIAINDIEKNIIAYKGPSASSVIFAPRLPLDEDYRILRLIAHLIGDGHVDGAFGTNLPKGKSSSYYANTSLDLVKSFQKDLEAFGKFETKITIENRGVHEVYKIIIPASVGYILSHVYKVNFDCFGSRIPKYLYKLSKKQLVNFIKAFGDDEAHVYDSKIEFYSSNLNLIEDLRKLIALKFHELKISNLGYCNYKERKKYYFSILSDSLVFYAKHINFDHKQKKEDLLFNLKRSELNNRHNQRRDTGIRILKDLSNFELTAKQLSRKYCLGHGYVLKHLRKLKNENKVTIVCKNKFSNVWGIKTSSYLNDLPEVK